MTRHGAGAIEIGKHDGRCIAYGTVSCGTTDVKTGSNDSPAAHQRLPEPHGQRVQRDAQPVQSDGGRIDQRPGTQQPPVQV